MNTKIIALSAAIAALILDSEANAGSVQTTNISFDGFCNVMQISVFSWHQAGTFQTSCQSGHVGAGMEGKVLGAQWKGKTLTIGENPNTSGVIYRYNIQYPFKTGGGWSLYSSANGYNFSLLNSGTYTIVGADERSPRVGPTVDRPVRNQYN